MKKSRFAPALLPLLAALFAAGCADVLMGPPELPQLPQTERGEGLLVISLAGVNVGSSRTMLPLDPRFTRYELKYSSSTLSLSNVTISFYNSALQLSLEAASDYKFTVLGYAGDTLVAKSDEVMGISISSGTISNASFTLKPYMDTASSNPVPGTLSFSLNWDGLSRMPWRAELLIETYAGTAGTLIDPPAPLDHTLIPPEFSAGSVSGSIRLLDRDSAFVNLAGSLTLPPGEYRLTMSVTMDPDTAPASRLDFAHVYSNLTTPAPFYYGGGDLYISNTSPDSGASFITGFTFDETPNATTVIGSEPGLDGARMIMIMVPSVTSGGGATNLANLTPIVTTAAGSVITSPLPVSAFAPLSSGYINEATPPPADPGPITVTYGKGQIDFTVPTLWTAQAKNGAVQKYTVVVSMVPDGIQDKSITYFFFDGYANYPGIIDQSALTITVTLPYNTIITSLVPVISIIGQKVQYSSDGTSSSAISPPIDFSSGTHQFCVYASTGDVSPKKYALRVEFADTTDKEITHFVIDGYPDRPGVIAPDSPNDTIKVTLPYGVSLKNLTPLVQYKGKTLDPVLGTAPNFSGPVQYTVTADDGTAKTYEVTVTNDAPEKNTGIFDFRVANVPLAKVVIGQKPRQDGKIPIVIQAPYGTDETNMIADITLSSPLAKIHPFELGSPSTNPASGAVIPFDNNGNAKEAVYRVTSQGDPIAPDPLMRPATQDYVVVVSAGGQYYYVDGQNGDDTRPDYYNGETEGRAFKTLAHAVAEASKSGSSIKKIFILGDLTAASQTGTKTDSSLVKDDSVITLDFTAPSAVNKTLTIASASGAALRGASGKRVLAIKGDGVNLTFENISVTGGGATGNGGGVYITGNRNKVKFSGGNITGNSAYSGGGVFIEDGDNTSGTGSEFDLMGGEISGNTATGAAAGNTADGSGMGGGGGVYVSGDSLFWLAGGTIANNTTNGAGGGVLVNGIATAVDETGIFMSGGRIVNNKSTSTTYPHGGGGVYVAHGAFEMLGGEITGNTATRQGGGVFVHWGGARFTASGDSTITGNDGVGSSKAICNRGTTELLGNARADKVYVWNYDDDPPPRLTTAPISRASNWRRTPRLPALSWPGRRKTRMLSRSWIRLWRLPRYVPSTWRAI
jgi:hypothetical protein